jgi:hypothetical protein
LFVAPLQAEREEGKLADLQQRAQLDAQAAALRARMAESHLAKFRSEAKSRWVGEEPVLALVFVYRQFFARAWPNHTWPSFGQRPRAGGWGGACSGSLFFLWHALQ